MWSLILAGVLGLAQVQQAGFDLPSLEPAIYSLDGYLGKAPEGQTVQYKTVIGFGPSDRTYLITKYTLEGPGDPFALFRNLGMFKPDFILLGPEKELKRIIDAKEGSRVRARFVYRRGMHTLELDPRSLQVD